MQTTTSQINHIHDSDTELAEKNTQILKIYEKNSKIEGKPSLKKWCNYCRRYGIAECSIAHSIAEYRQKQQKIIRPKPQKTQRTK